MSRRQKQVEAQEDPDETGRLRLDRWLWHVRAFKTRNLAAERITGGGVRVNGQPCRKPGRAVGAGDVVTFALGAGNIRVYEVLMTGTRRGPASEAVTLYRDMTIANIQDEDNSRTAT